MARLTDFHRQQAGQQRAAALDGERRCCAVKGAGHSNLHGEHTGTKSARTRAQLADSGAETTAHGGGPQAAAATQVRGARADDSEHGDGDKLHQRLPHLATEVRGGYTTAKGGQTAVSERRRSWGFVRQRRKLGRLGLGRRRRGWGWRRPL
jgi:hypothetical protein